MQPQTYLQELPTTPQPPQQKAAKKSADHHGPSTLLPDPVAYGVPAAYAPKRKQRPPESDAPAPVASTSTAASSSSTSAYWEDTEESPRTTRGCPPTRAESYVAPKPARKLLLGQRRISTPSPYFGCANPLYDPALARNVARGTLAKQPEVGAPPAPLRNPMLVVGTAMPQAPVAQIGGGTTAALSVSTSVPTPPNAKMGQAKGPAIGVRQAQRQPPQTEPDMSSPAPVPELTQRPPAPAPSVSSTSVVSCSITTNQDAPTFPPASSSTPAGQVMSGKPDTWSTPTGQQTTNAPGGQCESAEQSTTSGIGTDEVGQLEYQPTLTDRSAIWIREELAVAIPAIVMNLSVAHLANQDDAKRVISLFCKAGIQRGAPDLFRDAALSYVRRASREMPRVMFDAIWAGKAPPKEPTSSPTTTTSPPMKSKTGSPKDALEMLWRHVRYDVGVDRYKLLRAAMYADVPDSVLVRSKETGLGRLLARFLRGRAFCTTHVKRPRLYLYDEASRLWKNVSLEYLTARVDLMLRQIDCIKDLPDEHAYCLTDQGSWSTIAQTAVEWLVDDKLEMLLDCQPLIISVREGLVIDLVTGVARERTKADMATREMPVAHRPGIDMTKFNKVIYDICVGDRELIVAKQRKYGYGLIGGTPEKLFYGYGVPNSGKSAQTLGYQSMLGLFSHELDESVIVKNVDVLQWITSPDARSMFLNWALEGAKQYFAAKASGNENPLAIPQKSIEMLATLQQRSDPVKLFFLERIVLKRQSNITAKALHDEYAAWARDREYKLYSSADFGARFARASGISGVHCEKGNVYKGIAFAPSDQKTELPGAPVSTVALYEQYDPWHEEKKKRSPTWILFGPEIEHGTEQPRHFGGEGDCHWIAKAFLLEFLNNHGCLKIESTCGACGLASTTLVAVGCLGNDGPVVFQTESRIACWDSHQQRFRHGRVDVGGLDRHGTVVVAIEVYNTNRTTNTFPRDGIRWYEVAAKDIADVAGCASENCELVGRLLASQGRVIALNDRLNRRCCQCASGSGGCPDSDGSGGENRRCCTAAQ
jgi:hypothetical protein